MNRLWLHLWWGDWFGRTITRAAWALPRWTHHWPARVAMICRCGDGFASLADWWHGRCEICWMREDE